MNMGGLPESSRDMRITIKDILDGYPKTLVPETPELLGIAKDAYRDGQQETIQRVIDSPKKYVAVIAPTGRGKSVIGVGVALMLLRQGKRAAVVTKTINLQEQYLRDFEMLGLMKGRANYGCITGHENAAEAPCADGGECQYKDDSACHYYAARISAVDNPHLVINYDLWAASWMAAGNKRHPLTNRAVYICDEAHLLDDSVRSAASVSISGWMKDRIGALTKIDAPTTNDLTDWVIWAVAVEDNLTPRITPIPTDPNEYRRKRAHIQAWKLARKLKALIGSGETVAVRNDKGTHTFEPVFAWGIFPQMTEKLEKVVLMSATMPDPQLMALLLGIDPEDLDIIELESTFPAYRRPLIIDPVVRVTKMRMTEDDLDTLVARVDHWLELWHDRKGIIHTHAFWLQDALIQRSRYRDRLLTHESRGLPAGLDAFRAAPPGTFLVSPSAHSGVDLPGDLVRAQLILKLPMPDLRDPVIAARKEEIPETYDLSTAQTLVQEYGRAMRSDDDWGETVILDLVPAWVEPAIVRVGD
jgi:Rad3-related DNA helicase